MTWASGFFDPNGNGWDITDLASILGLVLTVAAVLAVFRKLLQAAASKFAREVQEIVREEIATHTALIQPTSNGGKSLPDIAKRTDKIERLVTRLAEASGITD